MKYYNKDYENSIVDDKTEEHLEDYREINQEHDVMVMGESPIDLYLNMFRDPLNLIIIISLLSAFFISLCLTTMVCDVLLAMNDTNNTTFIGYFVIFFIIVFILIQRVLGYFFQHNDQ